MWLFRFARAWIWFGNAAGCSFVLGTAALYAYVLSEPHVSFTTTQLEPDILRYFTPTIWICYGVIAGHFILILRAVRQSLQQRRDTKPPHAIHPSRQSTAETMIGHTASAFVLYQPSACAWVHPIIRRCRATVQIRMTWALEQWTRYNAEITRAFMLWEIANQSYQANKMSRLISSTWINRLVALVIVLNCWFSLMVQYAMRSHRKAHVRLARLLLDSCLDVVYNIGIPLVIFYPYYRDYSGRTSVFPPLFYYVDLWYINALSELRQVFVTSWVDLVSKATGSIALLYRLHVVNKVLQKAQDPTEVARRTSVAESLDSTKGPKLIGFPLRLHSPVTKILDAVLLLWGLVILGLHVYSTIVAGRGESMGCLLETRPWGSSVYSCMVLEVSCVERQTTGSLPAIVDALDNVNPLTLQMLIISHCPALEVPSSLQNCSALSILKVYNTTIASWDESAAFRDATNPALQVLYFARVNMSEIPLGLLAPDFPQAVWDIEFCITNLTTFPDSIVASWHNVVYFVFELNPFITEVPDAVLNLPSVIFFQLGMNNIRALPDWAFEDRALTYLSLDGNPLDHLPTTVKTLQEMRTLGIRGTNISSFPSGWITAEPPVDEVIAVQADGSPLCEGLDLESPTTVGPFSITCRSGLKSMVTYPIAEEDEWRAIH